MKQTLKILTALLVIATLVMPFSACGSKKTGETDNTLLQGIFEKLTANAEYSQWKSGFGATTIEEKLDGDSIVISAKGQDPEKILGLNLGADDYMVKPFNPLEAVARVNATLRRARGTAAQARPADVLRCRDLELDLDACTLTCAGAPVELTPVELRIMTLLMEHPGRVFTKQQLYEAGWEEDYVAAENSVMVCLSKLRAKLGDDPQAYIRTIRGIGYRLEK